MKFEKRKKVILTDHNLYILDIRMKEQPKLLNNAFNNREEAIRAIRLGLRGRFSVFKIVNGEFAKKHGLLFKRNGFGLRDEYHVRKYRHDYPIEIMGNRKLMKYFRWNQQYKKRKQKANL